ncbi:MAG: hypothetical protein AB7G34_13850 [Hyphomicrobiales bacterium]
MTRNTKRKRPARVDLTVRTASDAGTAALSAARAAMANGAAPASIAEIAALCHEAADHLAGAHLALGMPGDGSDTALQHMDAALSCLKQVAAESEKRKGRFKTTVRASA